MVFEIRETEPYIWVFIRPAFCHAMQQDMGLPYPFCVGESEETESERLFISVSSDFYYTQHQLSCLQCTTATSTCRDICTTPVPQALTSHRWFSSSHFVPVECTKSSTLYLEWEGFASYLEGWTGTFKTDPDLKEVVVWTSHFVYF